MKQGIALLDSLRLEVPPESGMPMESLAIYFPVVLRDTTVLHIHWGTTILPVRIKAPYRPVRIGRVSPAILSRIKKP